MSSEHDGMVTVFESSDHNAEIEAEVVIGMLQASGVQAFLKGSDVLPGAHEVAVMVPEEQKEQAEQLIAEAKKAGPAAADEAERASEVN